MSETPKERWLPYAGFILAAGTIVWQGGQLSGKVQANSERISRLEAAVISIDDIRLRGQRNEDRLQFLVEQYKAKEPK